MRRGIRTRAPLRAAMAMTRLDGLTRPPASAPHATGSALNTAGIGMALVGWILAGIGFAMGVRGAFASAGVATNGQLAGQQALSFILAFAGLGTVLAGVLVIVWGIARQIWVRLASLRAALQALLPPPTELQPRLGGIVMTSPYGTAVTSAAPPAPSPLGRLVATAWSPTLLIGFALLSFGAAAGLSAVWTQREAGAALFASWGEGSLFLGEAALLSAVTFVFSTILAAIRFGDAELQSSLNVTIKILRPSWQARAALGLVAIGLLAVVAQFPMTGSQATLTFGRLMADATSWLQPFRDFGIGLLVCAVAVTLAAIADAYGFEFVRVLEIINTGR